MTKIRVADPLKLAVCPSVMAINARDYDRDMMVLTGIAPRMHIEVADGMFTRVHPMPFKDVWWPEGVRADIHVLCNDPLRHTRELLNLRPDRIIVHAEAEGNFWRFAEILHDRGISIGIALKPETPVSLIEPALDMIDHVLVVSGRQGEIGANTHLLTKVLRLKHLKPNLEVGWEGGINSRNAAVLVAAGVDVLNVGGLQRAADPRAAYERLQAKLQSLPLSNKQI